MALILKSELEKDEQYQSFVKKCHQCRQEIQQTELLFFMPPCQRTKSRYFNLDSLIYWADKVLKYKEKQDFSNSHYGKSGRIMGKMKSETIKHEREKMLPAIKINVTS